MNADPIKIATSLLLLAAFVGVLRLVVGNPTSAVAVMGAGATTVAGVTAALEGRPVKG